MLRELPRPLVNVPAISARQMQEVERLMAAEYGLDALQVMELAGRHLAHLGRLLFLKGRADGKAVVVLAGNSGKGGGAMAAARRLHQWGATVRLVLSHEIEEYAGIVGTQLQRLQRQGVIIVEPPAVGGNLILDGLMGLHGQGDPIGRISDLIDWANRQLTPVLSLELPAGLDAETGQPQHPCMRASATLALALPKAGILKEVCRAMVGEVFLGDLAVPPALYGAPGLEMKVGPIFSESDIVRLR
ncbi:MAG: Bifunctional NAD(P)H-hydrate repair enzyme Nnr [Bacteroidota bacterium]|jgi:NAD(P)H-hydrate epimerase